jgi:hypothetical protein
MRGLSFGAGMVAAFKADTLSLSAWQIGMYGFMAIAYFVISVGFGATLEVNSFEFWFMMKIAMIAGFLNPIRSTGGSLHMVSRKGCDEVEVETQLVPG